MKIRPLADRVVIKKFEAEEKTGVQSPSAEKALQTEQCF